MEKIPSSYTPEEPKREKELAETRKITTFHTPDGWDEELDKSIKGESFVAYARYMYPEEQKREKEFAEMINVPDVALLNSGMAAIVTAVEAEELSIGDVVLSGREVYECTKELYANLKQRGIKVIAVDSGNIEEISEKINTYKPRLIILESVANDPGNPEMQVCDMGKLGKIIEHTNLEYKEKFSVDSLLSELLNKKTYSGKLSEDFEQKLKNSFEEFKIGNNPFIFRSEVREISVAAGISISEAINELEGILKYLQRNNHEKLSLIVDNTLSSPHLYNITEETKESDFEMTVVESATKHFQEGQGKITMGIAYSKDANKIKKIKQKRAVLGTYLQPTSEREIPADITQTMQEIVRTHAENALALAKILDGAGLDVMHPNLEKHKQSELANRISPDGIVTLFYVKFGDDVQAKDFVENVYNSGTIKIGASFGHVETSMFRIGSTVRVAAGQEKGDDFDQIKDAFEHALK